MDLGEKADGKNSIYFTFSIDFFILYSLPRVAGYFKQNFGLIGAPDEHESAFASLIISLTFLLKAVLRCGMSTQSAGRRKDKASVLGIQRWRKIASRAPFGHVPSTSEYISRTMGWGRRPCSWERHEYLLGNFKDGEQSWLSVQKLYLQQSFIQLRAKCNKCLWIMGGQPEYRVSHTGCMSR